MAELSEIEHFEFHISCSHRTQQVAGPAEITIPFVPLFEITLFPSCNVVILKILVALSFDYAQDDALG